MDTDTRWRQRFQNFEKAIQHLEEAVNKKDLSELEKVGVIQIYEFTFELGWKTVKDFLEENNVAVKFPSDTIKEGFRYDVINNGDVWMDMLHKRNLMSHTYNETNAELAYQLIVNSYYNELFNVYERLKTAL